MKKRIANILIKVNCINVKKLLKDVGRVARFFGGYLLMYVILIICAALLRMVMPSEVESGLASSFSLVTIVVQDELWHRAQSFALTVTTKSWWMKGFNFLVKLRTTEIGAACLDISTACLLTVLGLGSENAVMHAGFSLLAAACLKIGHLVSPVAEK